MSAAVDILQRELEDQKAKLAALREQNKADIERGQRAQREVDTQTRHVNDLQSAINTLKQPARGMAIAA